MSHLSLVSPLGINPAIINCEDIINSRLDGGRPWWHDKVTGIALKCARNARENVKEEGTTTKVREAAIMKGELITPTRQYY